MGLAARRAWRVRNAVVVAFVGGVTLLGSSAGVAADAPDEPASVGGETRVGPVPPPSTRLSGAAVTSADGIPLPSTPLLDDFNRPDGPLGSTWAAISHTESALGIRTNVVKKVSGGIASAYWTGGPVGPDAEAYVDSNGVGCCQQVQETVRLYLRVQDVAPAAWDGYELISWFGITGNRWWIRKYVDGTYTDLAQVPTGVWVHMLFRAVGDRLEGWASNDGVNWSLLIQATDSTFQGAGYMGFAVENTVPSADNFGGGTLGGGGHGTAALDRSIGQLGVGRGPVGNNASAVVAEPVNTLTGAFVHAETDLSLASSGVPFEWTRTYTSADTAAGRFGQGWTDTYQASVELQPNGDALVKGDDGQRLAFPTDGAGQFVKPPGALATLESVASGYRLTTSEQLVYEFDSAGKLLSKRDRNGQGVTLGYDATGRLEAVTDSAGATATVSYATGDLVSGVALSDGRSVSYGYTSGRLTSVTDVRGKTWQYTYDTAGRLASIVDPLGHAQVSNVYDQPSGRVTSQTNATGDVTGFTWDEATETATVTDPRGHVWKDVYQDGVLAERIDATGKTTEFGFDADLNESSVKSPAGETTQMSYDMDGNLLTATAPASLGSAQKTFSYNALNDPTTVTDARGTVTSYTYTAAGNVETVTQGGVQQAAYTYDTAGRVLTATEANGDTTSYAYDSAGNVASVTGPDADGPGPLGQPVTSFTYDSQGNVLTRVDPKGNVAGCGCAGQFTTTFTYNPAGQELTETDPLGHTTTNVYDDAGRLVSSTDANGHTTTYAYDEANRLSSETGPDPDGAGPLAAPVTAYTYDDAGNKLTETDPRGNTTTFAYDDANRLVSTTAPDPDGAGPLTAPVTTSTYDANGNLASMVEPRGNLPGASPDDYRTTYSYDAAGRLLTTTDPLGHATVNVYDAVGNLSSVTDANGHTTGYAYDYAGRVLSVTAPDPDGAGPLAAPVTGYTYDAAGNRTSRTDANGHTTTWAFDALGRVVSEMSPDPDGAGPETPSVGTIAYDENGNLLSATDPNGNGTPTAGDGTTSYGYDRANRLVSVDYSDSTPDVTFGYDNVGNRVSMSDGSGTETRAYDALDRLLSVSRGNDVFSYGYDAAGNVTRRTYPDTNVVDYAFDPLNRVTGVTLTGISVGYAYDAASNLTQTTFAEPSDYLEDRVYDRAGRLTGVRSSRTHDGSVLLDITRTLDPVGNPLTETTSGAVGASVKTFAYDGMDRLTGVCFQAGSCPGGSDPFIRWSYDPVGNRLSEERPAGSTAYTYDAMDRMLNAGSTSYSYDRNGNQTAAGSRSFAWDLADRLLSTTDAGATTTYAYDGEGHRLSASVGPLVGDTTRFVWDTNLPLPELVREENGGGALLRRYVNGPLGPAWFTVSNSNSVRYFYHRDPLGSVRAVSGKSGGTQTTDDYEPYGASLTHTGTLEQPLGFTGQYHDPTGLYHLRARQYDPAVGRFLGVDPAPQGPGRPTGSSYVYSLDRPTTMWDPSGQRTVSSRRGQNAALGATSPTLPVRPPRTPGQADRTLAATQRPGLRSYCSRGKPEITRESDDRIGFNVDVRCDIGIFWYSLTWRASSPANDYFESGFDGYTFNWGKRRVHWSHVLSEDFSPRSGTFVFVSGNLVLYGLGGGAVPGLPRPQFVDFIVSGYTQ